MCLKFATLNSILFHVSGPHSFTHISSVKTKSKKIIQLYISNYEKYYLLSLSEEIPNFKDARLASVKSIPVNPESISLEERERLLDQRFLENQKPPSSEIEAMAAMLRMEPTSLRQWFRKRRAQSRRKGNNSGIISGDRRSYRVTAPTGGYPLPIVNKGRVITFFFFFLFTARSIKMNRNVKTKQQP